jgi:hypothetical protein
MCMYACRCAIHQTYMYVRVYVYHVHVYVRV